MPRAIQCISRGQCVIMTYNSFFLGGIGSRQAVLQVFQKQDRLVCKCFSRTRSNWSASVSEELGQDGVQVLQENQVRLVCKGFRRTRNLRVCLYEKWLVAVDNEIDRNSDILTDARAEQWKANNQQQYTYWSSKWEVR